MRPLACLVAALAVLAVAAPSVAQIASVDVLVHPDVVVTSASENSNGAVTCGDPCRPFTAEVRVQNTDDERRQFALWFNAHVDPPTGDCELRRTTPVHLFSKGGLALEPGEAVTVGGAARPQESSREAYWPAAIYERYGHQEGTVATPAGVHTFCIHMVDQTSGVTETCESPCVRATASFEAYVRTSNEQPHGSFDWQPKDPTPGREVVFSATVADNDTVPKPDTLVVTWDFGTGDEAEGRTVRTTFPTADTYTVTMTISDGFDRVERTRTLEVALPGNGGDDGRVGQPFPWLSGLVAVLAFAALRRRTR